MSFLWWTSSFLKRFSTCFHYTPVGLPPHLCLSLVLYFFAVIRKSSITDSLGVWKLLRGVVKSYRTENRVGIIGNFFVAVWTSQCYHSSMGYYFHKSLWMKNNHACLNWECISECSIVWCVHSFAYIHMHICIYVYISGSQTTEAVVENS